MNRTPLMTHRPASISIIVPCYNGALHLRETLESALTQTMPPLEVIVVDDGSTDDSVAIAGSFGAAVRVVRQKNRGVSVARNNGIEHAKGDYLIFLDADDLLARDALAVMSQRLEQAPGSAVVMSFVFFDETPQNSCSTWSASSVTGFFPHLVADCIGFPGAWLFPRQAVLRGWLVRCRRASVPVLALPLQDCLARNAAGVGRFHRSVLSHFTNVDGAQRLPHGSRTRPRTCADPAVSRDTEVASRITRGARSSDVLVGVDSHSPRPGLRRG